MIAWAEKIDAAGYTSVQEAILDDTPALRINFSLMSKEANSKPYCEYLITQMRQKSLSEVAGSPEVTQKYEEVRKRIRSGLDQLQANLMLVEDIVTFDVESSEQAIFSRYAPYYFFPEAAYSIGITRFASGAKITAMRNPWRNFESVPLGQIFAR